MSTAKARLQQALAQRRFWLKRLVPRRTLDWALVAFPPLQRTRLVNYETLLDPERVRILTAHLEQASALDGEIVECGTARGGSAVIMARTLQAQGTTKTIFACDSFSGFDLSELAREREAGLTAAPDHAFTKTSLEYVTRKFETCGVSDLVRPVPGYFEDTLPTIGGRFCFAFIDCDLRRSVAYCAGQLWPQITPGGRILFDDYHDDALRGAELGVRDFLAEHGSTVAAHGEDGRMYWVQKSLAPPVGVDQR